MFLGDDLGVLNSTPVKSSNMQTVTDSEELDSDGSSGKPWGRGVGG